MEAEPAPRAWDPDAVLREVMFAVRDGRGLPLHAAVGWDLPGGFREAWARSSNPLVMARLAAMGGATDEEVAAALEPSVPPRRRLAFRASASSVVREFAELREALPGYAAGQAACGYVVNDFVAGVRAEDDVPTLVALAMAADALRAAFPCPDLGRLAEAARRGV